MTNPSALPTLAVQHLSRRFSGVQALDDVSFDVLPGEVHALVGENGAGKSTLINMLAGVLAPSNGTLEVNGKRVTFPTPASAQRAGVGVIFQEFNLLPHLSVAENIYLNREPRRGFVIDWPELYRRARAVIQTLEIDINPRTPVQELPVAQQQLVEIARALSMDPKVIIMDEPTAALSEREVERLLYLVKTLAARGVGVIYVSHRLNEVFTVADRITVLRDGRHILTAPAKELTEDSVVAAMVGRELLHTERPTRHPGNVVLSVHNLAVEGSVQGVSFDLHAGEVIGLAGLMGSGCTQVLEALFGLRPITAGTVTMAGKSLRLGAPRQAQRSHIGFVPEDRKRAGIMPDLSVLSNFSIAVLDRVTQILFLNRRREGALLNTYRDKLHMRYSHAGQLISGLSGGNQQKVILARSLAQDCRVLLLSEPTRGVDVGAKAEIYALIDDLVAEGMAVLLQSSELPEVLRLSDRCIVFAGGKPQGELSGAALDQPTIMHLATGLAAEQGPPAPEVIT
jgi:ribose transport system ATP-binding protein